MSAQALLQREWRRLVTCWAGKCANANVYIAQIWFDKLSRMWYNEIKKGEIKMDKELLFWLIALVVGLVFVVRVMLTPKDLYYEGRLDKIGGKGGR